MRCDTKADASAVFWHALKHGLLGPDGNSYYEYRVKDALIPGGTNGVRWLQGTVVSVQLSASPPAVLLALSDAVTPEVKLELGPEIHATMVKMPPKPGRDLAFMGQVINFSKNPFLRTIRATEAQWDKK